MTTMRCRPKKQNPRHNHAGGSMGANQLSSVFSFPIIGHQPQTAIRLAPAPGFVPAEFVLAGSLASAWVAVWSSFRRSRACRGYLPGAGWGRAVYSVRTVAWHPLGWVRGLPPGGAEPGRHHCLWRQWTRLATGCCGPSAVVQAVPDTGRILSGAGSSCCPGRPHARNSAWPRSR